MIEIIHISDLHFGEDESQNSSANQLLNSIEQRYPFEGVDNRYLLVTGDITDYGKPAQYELAKQALLPFAGKLFIAPGNHDCCGSFLPGLGYSAEKARYFDDPFAKALGFAHPFFGKKVFSRLLPDPSGSGALVMIGLNSCCMGAALSEGEIGSQQMDELRQILEECDPNIPKVLFLHHIPNREADLAFAMDLVDRKELMSVVQGKVDVLAFGHQGKTMQVDHEGKLVISPAPCRAMKLRTLTFGGRSTWVLDADSSVAEQKIYLIKLDGGRLSATVERPA
jgi:hypothetical protein